MEGTYEEMEYKKLLEKEFQEKKEEIKPIEAPKPSFWRRFFNTFFVVAVAGLFIYTLHYLLTKASEFTGYYVVAPNFIPTLVILVSIPYIIVFYLIFRKSK